MHWFVEKLKSTEEPIALAVIFATMLAGILGDAWWWVIVGAMLLSFDGWPRYQSLVQRAKEIDAERQEHDALARRFNIDVNKRGRISALRVMTMGVVVSFGNGLLSCGLSYVLGCVIAWTWNL